jgi:hypothetical protein
MSESQSQEASEEKDGGQKVVAGGTNTRRVGC